MTAARALGGAGAPGRFTLPSPVLLIDEYVGQMVKAHRAIRGISQAQLGARLEPPCSHAWISQVEGGQDMKLSTLVKLAAALGIRPRDLLP